MFLDFLLYIDRPTISNTIWIISKVQQCFYVTFQSRPTLSRAESLPCRYHVNIFSSYFHDYDAHVHHVSRFMQWRPTLPGHGRISTQWKQTFDINVSACRIASSDPVLMLTSAAAWRCIPDQSLSVRTEWLSQCVENITPVGYHISCHVK